VVWTDVIQTLVYLLGALAAAWLIGRGVPDGWSGILSTVGAEGKLRIFDLSLGLDKPYTLAAGLIGGAFLSMASHGADQLIVQRLLAAPSVKGARKALIGSGVAVILQFLLFLLIGVGLYAYYEARQFASPDEIFPSFIVDVMPAGLTGLVVAAILAAAMSTVSGSLNSLSAATTHDLYLPISGRRADDPAVLKVGKVFTLVWAVILIGGALLYHQEGTPVVVVALSIASFTYGGLLGGFGLALLWRRAIQRDAITGMAIGIFAMTLVVFAKQLTTAYPSLAPLLGPFASIAWPWYVLIGTIITITAGIFSSYTHPAPEALPAVAEELT
jgi:Na+/proline symporter